MLLVANLVAYWSMLAGDVIIVEMRAGSLTGLSLEHGQDRT